MGWHLARINAGKESKCIITVGAFSHALIHVASFSTCRQAKAHGLGLAQLYRAWGKTSSEAIV